MMQRPLYRRGLVRCLWPYAGVFVAMLLPIRFSEAQVPPADIPTNKVLLPRSPEQVLEDAQRRYRSRDKASVPRERGETRPFGQVPGAPLETFKDSPPR